MKLMRVGERGQEKPAVWASDGEATDVSSVVRDFDPDFFAGGGIEKLRGALQGSTLPVIDLNKTRIGPPLHRPSKFMAVGLNYSDHAKETNASIPEKPIFFDKATS